jgi:hypothetical protein
MKTDDLVFYFLMFLISSVLLLESEYLSVFVLSAKDKASSPSSGSTDRCRKSPACIKCLYLPDALSIYFILLPNLKVLSVLLSLINSISQWS